MAEIHEHDGKPAHVHFTRWQKLGLIALAVLVFGAFAVLVATLFIQTRSTVREVVNGPGNAPFAYSAPEYAPSKPVICPGEAFTYTVSFEVLDDAIVHVYTTLGSAELGRPNWRSSGPPQVFIQEQGSVITSTLTYTVPLGLPPGRFRLRLGAENSTSKSSITVVPFEIPTGCPP
jgi:hypothetical protein